MHFSIPTLRTPAARYGTAAAVTITAALIRWGLTPVLQDRGASLFLIPAVMVAAMAGGFKPGLLATGLGALFLDFVLLPPVFADHLSRPSDYLRVFVFCGVGTAVSWLADYGRQSQLALVAQREALRESEERLRLAADSAKIGFYDWEVQNNRIIWTGQMEELHCLNPGTFDGTLDQWRRCVHPEDLELAENSIQEAVKTGVHRAEWRVVWPDGSIHWLEARGWVDRDADGTAVRMMGVNIDITARKQAEQALITGEASFRALIENAPDAVFIASQDGVYLGANANVTRLLGYSPEEFIGKRIVDLIRPEEAARLAEAKGDPARRSPHLAEWQMRHRDGHFVSVELSSRMLPDGRWVAFARDVSARRAEEEALRTSEARFRQMADTAPAMLWITEPDGHCSFLSRGWYEFTGQDEETGLGFGWTKALHSEDQERAGKDFRAANERREDFRSEFRLCRTDGECRWVLDAGRPRFDADGTFCGMIGSVIDIHDRKTAEDRLRTMAAVVENCAEFIGICDLEMRPIYLNEAGREMVGLDSTADVQRSEILDYFWPEDLPMIQREAIPVLVAGKPWAGEVRFRNFRTGEPIHTIWNAFVIRGSDGQPLAWATVSPNLNAIKAAEASARGAMEIAEAANRAKDAFLAALSHELRTPLNPVLMLAADQSRNESLTEEIRADFALIQQNVALEVRLIDDLLDLTRITRGKLDLREQPCDLHSLLDATLEILRGDIAAKKLKVTKVFEAAPNQKIDGDPVRLQQVFWNILRNSVRYTHIGGSIIVKTGELAPDRVSLSITDTGVGIAVEDLPKLFAPFEQGSAGHRFGGLGLGLAISKSLVEMHGGKIHAWSEGRDRGATFTVELPSGAIETSEPLPVDSSLRPPVPLSSLRILLVEDHEPTRRTLGRLLQRRGYEVESVGDLASARHLVSSENFDLFISDLGLPDGDGCDLMKELSRQGGPPGIALSGYGMEEDVERSHSAGFSAHLTKPVDMDALDRVLGTWAGRRASVS